MIPQSIYPHAFVFMGVLNIGLIVGLVWTVSRVRQLQRQQQIATNHQRTIQHDVKGLFDSASGFAKRLHILEKRTRALEENQEQLTLKEPTQQTYQHAIRLLKEGQPIEKVVENSGLSRGELELLSLLRRIEDGESLNLS